MAEVEVERTDDGESSQEIESSARFDDEPAFTRRQFVVWGVTIESATFLIAFGLAYFSGQHFWRGIEFNRLDIVIGIAAVGPMLLVFWLARDLRNLVEKLLGPALSEASLLDLAVVALLAGVCEEALFRGVLEPWWSGQHWMIGFLAANILFGLLHAASLTYFILATSFGAYFSLITWAVGEPNLLRAIVCHAVYDFLAFWYLGWMHRRNTAMPSIS